MHHPLDEFPLELLRGNSVRDAVEWLSDTSSYRTLGEWTSQEESLSFVKRLMEMGATKVVAVEIDVDPDGENTGKLVIELPDAEPGRGLVLAECNRIGEEQGFGPDPDEGQRYAFVMLD